MGLMLTGEIKVMTDHEHKAMQSDLPPFLMKHLGQDYSIFAVTNMGLSKR